MRSEHDFYQTPGWATRAILRDIDFFPTLDPCAGDGAILDACDAYRPDAPVRPRGFELNVSPPRHLESRITMCDGLAASWKGEIVLMNPPFSGIEKWLEKTEEAAFAVVLMRLGVLCGQRRRSWWLSHQPAAIRFLSKRPSFTHGGTDSSDYAWVVWSGTAWKPKPFGWLVPG